jgi:acetyltransferase
VNLRRVAAADADALQRFVVALSPASRRWRFHGAVNGCTASLLRHLTQANGMRHVAFVACAGAEIVGEARYFVTADGRSAEFAIVVADSCQGRGVAAALMAQLSIAASQAGLCRLYGDVLDDNERMTAFMRRQGLERAFDDWPDAGPGVQRWERTLQVPTSSARARRAARGAWRLPSLSGLLGQLAVRVAERL